MTRPGRSRAFTSGRMLLLVSGSSIATFCLASRRRTRRRENELLRSSAMIEEHDELEQKDSEATKSGNQEESNINPRARAEAASTSQTEPTLSSSLTAAEEEQLFDQLKALTRLTATSSSIAKKAEETSNGSRHHEDQVGKKECKTCPEDPEGTLNTLQEVMNSGRGDDQATSSVPMALLQDNLAHGYTYGAGCALKDGKACGCGMPWFRECSTSIAGDGKGGVVSFLVSLWRHAVTSTVSSSFILLGGTATREATSSESEADRVQIMGYCRLRDWVWTWPVFALALLAWVAQRYLFQPHVAVQQMLEKRAISSTTVSQSGDTAAPETSEDDPVGFTAYGALLHASARDGTHRYGSSENSHSEQVDHEVATDYGSDDETMKNFNRGSNIEGTTPGTNGSRRELKKNSTRNDQKPDELEPHGALMPVIGGGRMQFYADPVGPELLDLVVPDMHQNNKRGPAAGVKNKGNASPLDQPSSLMPGGREFLSSTSSTSAAIFSRELQRVSVEDPSSSSSGDEQGSSLLAHESDREGMMGSSSVNLTSSGSAGTDPSPMLQHVSPSTGRSGYYAVGPGVRLLQSAQKEQRTSQQLEMKPSTLPMGYTRSNSSPTTGGLGLDEFLEGDGHSHQDHTTNYNNQEYDGHGVGVAITSTRNGGRVLTSSFSRAIRSPTLDEAEDQYPKMISISNDSTRSPNKNRRTSASPPFSSSKNSPPFSSSKNAAVPAPRIGMIRQLHHDDNQLDEVENFESERPVDLVGRFFYDMDPSPSDDNLARAHLASSGRGGDQKSWEARKSIDYVEYILHSSSSSSGEEEGRDDTNTSSLTAAAEYFAIDTPSVSKQGHPTRGQNATSSGHGKDQQKNSGNRIDEVVRQEVGKERREALPQPMQDHEDNRTFIFEDSQEDIDQQRMIITEEHDIDVTQFLDHQHLPFFSPMEPRDAEATLLLGSTGEAS